MKTFAMLVAMFFAALTNVYATDIYDDYDAFYATQPGALFNAPLKHEEGKIYSNDGENDIYSNFQEIIGGKTIDILISSNQITVNKKTYKFSQATAFPGLRTVDIYPGAARVFVSERKSNHPQLLCLEGNGSGSGEADRYQQIYLLMAPLTRKPAFLHLPALLSSCKAVLAMTDGRIAFPNNTYLWNEAKDARVGLLVAYYAFDHARFNPINKEIRLHFLTPENPFEFSKLN
ncbi:hypothetical protein [Paraburkholderia silvatlantica]|uniref:Outer membrane lipoprotein-sorting protein n=1 Tax=Paraburkholderia silvatlantica TaxID=321895 RepID=A0A2U1AG41_9BURK|nr:hypothetical protein [Paraburkholderia silvatlantica]MBB2928775.1 hypothetical protein [Paraburkholderia silvatlantica]PVY35358.1 hypothetical protein C7411_105151 [Paraburkholderia silvatlantica]PXW41000.1 hypothetical protein C7413_103151 [Paraburkholderia silvatlantica]PYE27466.1 hypothetical protein C7410_102149 [Paraburkholderia silvatlantica]TDQ98173.1 hypothetical protein C7412_106148 [Paraburkholderia silvatlantica]